MTAKFGYLTYIKKSDKKTNDGRYLHELRCECGEIVLRSMNNLEYGKRNGRAQSCGCMKPKPNLTHGMRNTRVYKIWRGMKDRATNQNSRDYKRGYGLKGMDPRWESFDEFYSDMGDPPSEKHQIDRINNGLGYSKDNCRWTSQVENSRNRDTSCIWMWNGIEFNSISEAASHFGHAVPVVHRWFKGYMNRGKWIGPRDGFTFRKKYDDIKK